MCWRVHRVTNEYRRALFISAAYKADLVSNYLALTTAGRLLLIRYIGLVKPIRTTSDQTRTGKDKSNHGSKLKLSKPWKRTHA